MKFKIPFGQRKKNQQRLFLFLSRRDPFRTSFSPKRVSNPTGSQCNSSNNLFVNCFSTMTVTFCHKEVTVIPFCVCLLDLSHHRHELFHEQTLMGMFHEKKVKLNSLQIYRDVAIKNLLRFFPNSDTTVASSISVGNTRH